MQRWHASNAPKTVCLASVLLLCRTLEVKTRVHKAFFYLTYVCWFGARVVLPLYNVYVLWERIIPSASESPFYVLPVVVFGHLIAAFCVGVFAFVWTPNVLAKWLAPVLQLDEYSGYELTLRQGITPRASPLTTPSTHTEKSVGFYNSNHVSNSSNNYGTTADP